MGVEQQVIYHTVFTCDECGGQETTTDLRAIDAFVPSDHLPVSMTSVHLRIDQKWQDAAVIHKTCVRLWLSKITIP